jgi:hypothetical protein
VALLELLTRAAPARVVATDLVLVVEHALLDGRQRLHFALAAVFGVALPTTLNTARRGGRRDRSGSGRAAATGV